MTGKKVAANRANGRRSAGAVTPEGKARAAAANLRHGYYSKSAGVALAALGEDPGDFERRLDLLMHTFDSADSQEMSLVMRLSRSLWRMQRLDRMQESIAVKHLERVLESKKQSEAIACMPLFGKQDRLKELCCATCPEQDVIVGPPEMKLFEKACHDVTEKKANQILRLLLRLRKTGAMEELAPQGWPLPGAGEVPLAEGEEREVVRVQLRRILKAEINSLTERIMRPGGNPNDARAQFDRDEILAAGQPKAALMDRGENRATAKRSGSSIY